MKQCKIGIYTDSVILFNGFCSVAKQIHDYSLLFGRLSIEELRNNPDCAGVFDIFVCDPLTTDASLIDTIRKRFSALPVIALCTTLLPPDIAGRFTATLSVYDTADYICKTLLSSLRAASDDEENIELTVREKEIVAEVVRGMSNKEIATQLNVSVNTVMTHRRNIASKLGIHSPAGLTIYALANKLVNIDDISPA